MERRQETQEHKIHIWKVFGHYKCCVFYALQYDWKLVGCDKNMYQTEKLIYLLSTYTCIYMFWVVYVVDIDFGTAVALTKNIIIAVIILVYCSRIWKFTVVSIFNGWFNCWKWKIRKLERHLVTFIYVLNYKWNTYFCIKKK